MTATIKRPGRRSATQKRRVRFSSLESLGFTNVASTWSDSPTIEPETPRGRHLAAPPRSEDLADWQPQDFGRRLTGSNIRWGVIVMVALVIGAVAAFGFWLYQRPAAIEQAADIEVTARAQALESAMPVLIEFNQGLLGAEFAKGAGALDSVESVARRLFDISASLDEIDRRSAASQAAGSALDGVQLAREAHAYRSAVLPMLATPDLETDPELIALDEAARMFGDWQLAFDDVRTALPDRSLSGVTEQLDILSRDLTSFLGRYVDALRNDDKAAAGNALAALGSRLDTIEQALNNSIEDIQARVQVRVDETLTALDQLLPH